MTVRIAPEVFISYESRDRELAEEVHRRLRGAGFDVWFDSARLKPGFDWHKEIEAACNAARVVLPVLTPRWRESLWTRFETYGAECVIPLIFEGAVEEVLPGPIKRFQGERIELASADDEKWRKVIDAVRRSLGGPAPVKFERVADVRYRKNLHFVGRESQLIEVHERMHPAPNTELTQGNVVALSALGGVGKTTFAREYVEKFWRCYPQIFWIDCRRGLEAEFARIYAILFPGTVDGTEIDEKARRGLRRIEERRDLLLIFDNAADELSVQAWIPKTGHSRVLITSRFKHWSAAIESTPLDLLARDSARALLLSRSKVSFEELPAEQQLACDELNGELGSLALALEQAAAYIAKQGSQFSVADYLKLYRKAAAELLAAGVLGSTEYPKSVLTTWKTTTDKLASTSRAILRLCAFLAPVDLPLTVLVDGVEMLIREAFAFDGDRSTPMPLRTEPWVREHVSGLLEYSMVESDGQSITIHPLVQAVERFATESSPEGRAGSLGRALNMANSAFVGDESDPSVWSKLEPLAPHALAVVRHADNANILTPTIRLSSVLGGLFMAKGAWEEAERSMRLALEMAERLSGPMTQEVANHAGSLGLLLRVRGRFDEAEVELRRALRIDELCGGDSNAHTAQHLNGLGEVLFDTNRLPEAEPVMVRALRIDKQQHQELEEMGLSMRLALAQDDRFIDLGLRVARDLSNLARVFESTGRVAEAERMMRTSLEMKEQTCKAGDPEIAVGANNLAHLLQETKKLSKDRLPEAEGLYRRALDIDEKFFGSSHQNVARRLSNLAQVCQDQGKSGEAETLMLRVVEIDRRVYGEAHPDYAQALCNLARTFVATGRLSEAEKLIHEALPVLEGTLGPDHPRVASALAHMGSLLVLDGRAAEAEQPMLRRLQILLEFTRENKASHPRLDVASIQYERTLVATGATETEARLRLNKILAPYELIQR